MSTDVTRARIGSTLRMLAATAVGTAIALGATGAVAGDWKKGPYVYGPPYAKVPPGHVRYYAPAPVVYAPPPVVVYPAPVAYAPVYPVYAPPAGVTINLPLR